MSQLKDVAFWDEEYVTTLQVGEPDWLDCKESAWFTLDQACFDKLAKYLSAFANYDGGYLVIGAKDPRNNLPLEIDGGVPLAIKPKLKDWLEDKLPNLVESRLEKINVRIIEPTSAFTKIKPQHCLVIIHVPESIAAPHQGSDHKYWNRVGGKLNPLKHRAVLDIIHRKRHPNLELRVRINVDHVNQKNTVFWRLRNTSNVLVRDFFVVLKIPFGMGKFDFHFGQQGVLYRENLDEPIYWRLLISNNDERPLFPSDEHTGHFLFTLTESIGLRPSTIPALEYIIFADEMPAIMESKSLEESTHWFNSITTKIVQ